MNNIQYCEYRKTYMRQYRKKHGNIYRKVYYALHKEKTLKQAKKWRLQNKERIYDTNVKYHNTFRGKLSIKNCATNRRMLTKDLNIDIIQRVYEDNIKQYGTLTCYLCLNPIQFGSDQLEHRIPLSRGGSNLYENLGVACGPCNNNKGTKTEEEYRD